MNWFSSLISTFCVSCVAIGALYMICPDGNMSKPVKYIFALCFILSVIGVGSATMNKADLSLDFNGYNASYSDNAQLQTSAAEFVYSFALESAGIEFNELTVCTDKSEDGSISISKVIIRSDCQAEKISAALSQVAENIEVEIINE